MKDNKKLAFTHFTAMAASLGAVMAAHHVYDKHPGFISSLFFPVNESIFEHAKLFMLPVLALYLIVYLTAGKKYKNYLPAALLSTVLMTVSMCIIFQAYLMIAGTHHPSAGIIVSVLILFMGFIFTYLMAVKITVIGKKTVVLILVLTVLLIAAEAVFTYYPPKAQYLEWLFWDHENMCCGIVP